MAANQSRLNDFIVVQKEAIMLKYTFRFIPASGRSLDQIFLASSFLFWSSHNLNYIALMLAMYNFFWLNLSWKNFQNWRSRGMITDLHIKTWWKKERLFITKHNILTKDDCKHYKSLVFLARKIAFSQCSAKKIVRKRQEQH